MYSTKDFIATTEDLLFAVVTSYIEDNKILCFLRYIKTDTHFVKVNTEQANQFLAQHHPHYLHRSKTLDASLHAVPINAIKQHYQPRKRLKNLLQHPSLSTLAERDCQRLCRQLERRGLPLHYFGITGSLLPGVHHQDSDIDLVCYDRTIFQQLLSALPAMLQAKECNLLSHTDWLESYQRRQCALSLAEYIWHEQRKLNKVMLNGRKIDFSLLHDGAEKEIEKSAKIAKLTLTARVIDDRLAYDSPAEYSVDHPTVSRVVCFTPTYAGQARTGETIEVAGTLEVTAHGLNRIVVGSNREAEGEYIKVVNYV